MVVKHKHIKSFTLIQIFTLTKLFPWHMRSEMGPIWDLSGATLVPYGLPLWGPYGFANDFVVGPTWVQIRDPHGTYLGQHGSHTAYQCGPLWGLQMTLAWVPPGFRYGTHMGPIWDNMAPIRATIMGPFWVLQITLIVVGPTWVQILDPHKTYLGQHVANSGYNYGAHMGFANYFDMSHVRRPTFILKFPQNEMVFLFMSPVLSSQNVGLLRLGDY